ncbi:hypothetical protein ACRAWD_23155 [Caulobacter segnis]
MSKACSPRSCSWPRPRSRSGRPDLPAIADIAVKRAMIKSASKAHLAADSPKIGKTSFSSLGGIENIHCLITDSGIRDEDHRAFLDAGIEVIVA